MSIVLLGLLAAATVAGAWSLARFAGYGSRDLAAASALFATLLFLSRFDAMLYTRLFDRPYPGIVVFMLLISVGLGLYRALTPTRRPRKMQWVMIALLFGIFAYLAILSGLVNRAGEGVAAALQALALCGMPILLAAQVISVTPQTTTGVTKLRWTIILAAGVLTPIALLATSLFADLLGRLLGWNQFAVMAGRSTGFVRGWSPLGGAISTAVAMVLAYGLAMHEVVGRGRRRFIPVLVLIGLAMLFTLSRSAILMMVVFHLAYFRKSLFQRPARTMAVLAAVSLVLVVALTQLSSRFSFDRFTQIRDASSEVRASSALAALSLVFDAPLLGQGPGLVYEEIRTTWLEPRELGSAKITDDGQLLLLENHLSAMEPHNLYLYLAVEHGWLALGCFLGLFIACWAAAAPPRGADEEAQSLSAALRALWVAHAAMFLTASTPLTNPQLSVFFWTFALLPFLVRASAPAAHRVWSLGGASGGARAALQPGRLR